MNTLLYFFLLLSCLLGLLLISLIIYQQIRKKHIASKLKQPIDFGEYVNINDQQQYLHHRGTELSNPVMLILHGGPGAPLLPFSHYYQPELEQSLTIVNWDQRGCGKSEFKTKNVQFNTTITLEQIVDDTKVIVDYLKAKYNQDKIIILGHSWGSVVGSTFASLYPNDVQIYIGVGQVVSMFENEKIGYEKAIEVAKKHANKQLVSKLHALAPYPATTFTPEMKKKIFSLRQIQSKLKIGNNNNRLFAKLIFESPFYSLHDSLTYLKMNQNHLNQLYNDLMTFAIPNTFEVPICLIVGRNDFVTPHPLAKTFFEQIKSSNKLFYTIEASGHFPMLDQPKYFTELVLKTVRDLHGGLD